MGVVIKTNVENAAVLHFVVMGAERSIAHNVGMELHQDCVYIIKLKRDVKNVEKEEDFANMEYRKDNVVRVEMLEERFTV
jgi:hypothetical protein